MNQILDILRNQRVFEFIRSVIDFYPSCLSRMLHQIGEEITMICTTILGKIMIQCQNPGRIFSASERESMTQTSLWAFGLFI